ncbi:MAG: YceI family protein [Actinomycetota bacterium]|nr:YceI family protein [Actinomycetota bacterium]
MTLKRLDPENSAVMARLSSGPPGTDDPEVGEPAPDPGTWTVDRASTVGFVARQFLVHRVRGSFGSFRATVEVSRDLLGSTIAGEVDIGSVDTGDPARDDHLRSAAFFDVARWPTGQLAGRVTGTGPHGHTAVTKLTIRDITVPVTFDVRLRVAEHHAGTSPMFAAIALATVNRKDFGLCWNTTLETGGVVVSDYVDLVLDIVAHKTPA